MTNEIASTIKNRIKVEVKDLPGQEYLGKRFAGGLGQIGHDVAAAFTELYERIGQTGSVSAGPPFLIASRPENGRIEVEVGAPCAPVPVPAAGQHRGRLAPGKAAVTRYRGAYDELSAVYSALFDWVSQNGYRPTCSPREIYLNAPSEVASPADFLTEVVLPIG